MMFKKPAFMFDSLVAGYMCALLTSCSNMLQCVPKSVDYKSDAS